jgi:DNA polymerase IV
MATPSLCRDCGQAGESAPTTPRCPACGSPRLVRHAELDRLAIAHVDCDAFYANVEKRDDPALRDRPVIVGGRHRGVVLAACYVARIYGVRSAMPMFKALALCPEATVVPPDMAKYRRVGQQIRTMMQALTPLVEPLSIDEAFLDLSGTERLHHAWPAASLAALARAVEREVGVTVSIGLSYNKFLAKVASDLDKPRGFAVIGEAEAPAFLAGKPVGMIWGVGKALAARLARDGISTIGQLQQHDELALVARFGSIGRRLARFARGIDDRRVDPDAPARSISAETTFDSDLSDVEALSAELWPLCETVARRLKRSELAARGVTLKLKTSDFRLIGRSRRLDVPTQLADRLFRAALALLEAEADGRRFRLIGVGSHDLAAAAEADPPDLLDPRAERQARVEKLIDEVRAKSGEDAIGRGRGLAGPPPRRR